MQIQKLSTTSCSLNALLDSRYYNDLTVTKVLNCPYCGVVSDHKKLDARLFGLTDKNHFLVLRWQCTMCGQSHVQFHEVNFEADKCDFISSYPSINLLFQGDPFAKLSPRFHELYSQVIFCEYNNQFDLAAMGLRTALEILCKDFAIAKLGAKIDDVKDLKLAETIRKFYSETELNNSANIARILGNNYSHYVNKHSEVDYFTLRKYFDAFLKFLEYKLIALTPIDEIHQ